MRRLAVLALACALLAGCSLRRHASPPPSPYCRGGDPLGGVYHPSRLKVKSRCAVATGIVERVKFEDFDGDVHVELRLDPGEERLLSRGNDRLGGTLLLEVIPQDRSSVAIPEPGQRISAVGPWVYDQTHDWNELHPVWSISAGRIVPASPEELRRAQVLIQAGSQAEDG